MSVRTLHHYDRIGLLRPARRTEARYRHYGSAELLRLQQILFYKELDFALDDIRDMLEDPEFDLLRALHGQRSALQARRERLGVLLVTIDQTISHLKHERTMLTNEELYAGFADDTAAAYRREIAANYGTHTLESAEQHLRQLGQPGLDQLKAEQQEIGRALTGLHGHAPDSPAVQAQVARHYANIVGFWGPSVPTEKRLEAYRGLAQLYLDDPRYTQHVGSERLAHAQMLSAAMRHFADQQQAK